MTDAFADLVMPIFQRVVELQTHLARDEPTTLDQVMRLTQGLIGEADRRAGADPVLKRSFDRARFGLVAWIDEVLTESEWGRTAGWGSEQHVLEWYTFVSRNRAFLFYEHAEAAAAHGDMDALEVYLLSVTLGFRGDHGSDSEKSGKWVDRVYGLISKATSVPSKPFPEDEAAGAGLEPLGGASLLVAVSSLFAVTALFTLAAYLYAVHYSFYATG